METQSTKLCPYCGETIRAQAVKCRCCKKMLDGSDQTHSDSNEEIKTDVELDSESNDAALNASVDGNGEMSEKEDKAMDRAAGLVVIVLLILSSLVLWGGFAMSVWVLFEKSFNGSLWTILIGILRTIISFSLALSISKVLKKVIKESFNAEN